jgi:hypothetical protein
MEELVQLAPLVQFLGCEPDQLQFGSNHFQAVVAVSSVSMHLMQIQA